MILKSALAILITYASFACADFDDSVIWKYYLPTPDYDLNRFTTGGDGLQSMFLHSNMYRINSLDWNFISLRYNKGQAGLGLEFSTVGYKDLYRRNKYRTRFRYMRYDKIVIEPLVEVTTEEFADFGNYFGLSGEIIVKYAAKKYSAGVGVSDIQLKEPYNHSGKEGLFPFLIGSWMFDEGLAFSIGVRRFDNGRTRWIFHQSVIVSENLGLNFGYQNNPSDIYGGLSLKFRGFSLLIDYNSVSGLSDSIIWGISYGR
jgi:hypothetical protein